MNCRREKRPLSLRVSVTDRCQLRCQYCMPQEGITACSHENILSFEEIEMFVRRLQETFAIRKLRLTGGDPLVRKGVVDLVSMLSALGIPDMAMTTNAQGLAAMAGALRAAGLGRINVSIDSLNESTFREITRGGTLTKTLDGIEAAIRAGLTPVKLNMVVMRGINDHEVSDMLSFAINQACELRFLELMPIGYAAPLFEEGFISAAAIRDSLGSQYTLDPVPFEASSSSRRYRASTSDGREGVVGFISACSEPFCSGCDRLRLTSDGRLIGCLAREEGTLVRPLLSDTDASAFSEAVSQALQGKRFNEGFSQPAPMAAIGG